jgi:hypothetical protein
LGGFGWLRATFFLVSAFSFQHFSFCQSMAWSSPEIDLVLFSGRANGTGFVFGC